MSGTLLRIAVGVKSRFRLVVDVAYSTMSQTIRHAGFDRFPASPEIALIGIAYHPSTWPHAAYGLR